MRWAHHLPPPAPPPPPAVFAADATCPFQLNMERFSAGGAPNDNFNKIGGLDNDFWEGVRDASHGFRTRACTYTNGCVPSACLARVDGQDRSSLAHESTAG